MGGARVLAIALFLAAPALAGEVPAKVDAALGKGVRAAGGELSVVLRARLQVRATESFPGDHGASADRLDEFAVRRARVSIDATWREVWGLRLQLGLPPADVDPGNGSIVRDAYVLFTKWPRFQLQWGQMKVPFDRSRLISSRSLALVDRAPPAAELSLDRDVGVQLSSDDALNSNGLLGYALGVFGGEGRSRPARNAGLLFVARLVARPFGAFDDLEEADLERRASPKLSLGVAVARNTHAVFLRSNQGDSFPSGTATSYLHADADLLFKWRGVAVLAEILSRRATDDQVLGPRGATVPTSSAWGWLVQPGVMLTDEFEVVARWSELRPFATNVPGPARTQELGGGVNAYLHGHDLKFQADLFRLADPDRDVSRYVLRAQSQFAF